MEIELSNEMIDKICANLRVIDFLRKNQEEFEKHPEMKKQMDNMRTHVKQLMDLLSDEQRDQVLEEHKIQSEAIEKKLAKKLKKKKGK